MRKIILILVLFLSIKNLYCQDYDLTRVQVDKALTPTASVASLGRYGNNSGVDNKGKYNTSLDITSLKSGNITYNMGISYSSNGLKLNEWGGRLGLLWSDNFTSAIYRTVRGLPDEYISQKVTGLEGGNYTQNQYFLIKEMVDALDNNNTAGKDGESDLFHYNIFGLTGSFVIVNNQVLQINYTEKLKIEVGSGFSNFTITLKNGTKYYYGHNNNIEYTTFDTQCASEMSPLPKQKTAWFLTKIEDVNSVNTINFNYGNISNYYTEDKSESITIKNKRYSRDLACNQHDWHFTFAPVTCTRYKIYDTKYLTNVSSTSFKISFLYNDREDLKNEKLLDLIEIKNVNDTVVNKVKFDYQKFGNNVSPPNQSWGYPVRYFLNKVSIGNDLSQKYTLSYQSQSQLPERFSYAQDLTGIYNGIGGSSFLPNEFVLKALPIFAVPPNGNPQMDGYPIPGIPSSDRTSRFPESTFGLLTSIQFPTGGKEKIFYEPNSVIKDPNTGVQSEFYGVRTKKVELWNNDSDIITKEYKYNVAQYDSITNNMTFGSVSSLYSDNDEYGGHVSSVYNWGYDPACSEDKFFAYYADAYYKISSNKIYDINRFQGDFIVYSDLTEITNGKKFITKRYAVTEDWFTAPQWGEINSYTPNSEYFWTANLIGNQYEGEIFNSIFKTKKISDWGYKFQDYQFVNNFVVSKDYEPYAQFSPSAYIENLNAYAVGKYIYPNRWYSNYKKSETTILDNGKKIIDESQSAYYDVNEYNNIKSVENTFSDGTTSKKLFTYSYIGDFLQNYMVGIPVITEEFKNDKIISRTYIGYGKTWWHHELLFPHTITKINLNALASDNEGSDVMKYNEYDQKGNLLQFTQNSGVPTTILYGYNKTLPIAKIEGLDYSVFLSLSGLGVNNSGYDNLEICQKSNSDINSFTEQELLDALDVFRKNSLLSSYNITTYTYDSLIGVTSITQPSGIREFYIYDSANRLKEIRENNATGKILKEFKYNYKP